MATTRKSSTTGKPASTPKTTRKTTSRSKTTARATGPAADPAPDPAVVVNAPTVVVAGVEMKKKGDTVRGSAHNRTGGMGEVGIRPGK